MTPLQNLTVEQLRKLIAIKEQIESLRGEIESIASGGSSTVLEKATADDESPARGQGRGVYKRSAAMRARMAAAQKARWAGVKGGTDEAGPKKKGKRKLGAAGRAAIIAGTKARWAKLRAAKGEAAPKKRRKMSAAGRARMVATAKARWATAKAAGKNKL